MVQKPVVPPKPDSPLKTLELCAKQKQLNDTFKEMQQQNLSSSRSSIPQVPIVLILLKINTFVKQKSKQKLKKIVTLNQNHQIIPF